MDNSKRCSKCKTCQPNNNFGNKTNGTEYKTCVKCRTQDKNKKNDTDTNNNSIIKTSVCLPSCYDPFKCIHDKKCRNHGKQCLNIKLKPFLNLHEVIYTCRMYGFKVLQLPDGVTKIPISWSDIQRCEERIDHVHHLIETTKSIIVVKCNNEFNLLKDLYLDSLPDEIGQHVQKTYPCIVLNFAYKNKRVSMVLDKCNTIEHFVSFNKIQHNRKCDICLNKTKHFVNCYRCDKRYCTNCFHSLQSLTCPFCQYDIFEHRVNLQNLYTVTM